MRFVLFISVFISIMIALNIYSYRRFLSRLHAPLNRYSLIFTLTLIFGNVFFVVEMMNRFIPDSMLLYSISGATIGVSFMVFVVALIYDLNITVSKQVPFDQERRKTLKILFDITMFIAAIAYLIRGLTDGLKYPEVNTVKVKIKDFPLPAYKIVQLSDVHVGRTIKKEFVEYLVEQTNSLSPDLVVITGDLVDLSIDLIKDDLQPLSQLNAPCYFIPGNHEYFHGVHEINEFITTLGIKPLLNDSVLLGKSDQIFNLVGLTDVVGDRLNILKPDIKKAYSSVDKNRPCIVLAHQPKFIERMHKQRCDLMLSGHTHGGQIFPFGFLVMFAQPYLSGLYQHNQDQQIFVSRGAGYWGPPVRILAPSEITQLIIHSS